jgi:hypothetical protein
MLLQGQTYIFEIIGGDVYVVTGSLQPFFSSIPLVAGLCISRDSSNRSLRTTPLLKIPSFSKRRRLPDRTQGVFICP